MMYLITHHSQNKNNDVYLEYMKNIINHINNIKMC